MQFELQKWTKRTLSAEERAQRMDQLLAEEEANVAAMEKEVDTLRKQQVRTHVQYMYVNVNSTLIPLHVYNC